MLESPLTCPKCKFNNMHHGEVQIFIRDAEDQPGRRIVVTDAGSVTLDAATSNFAGRRHDVRIRFTCEGCAEIRWLFIIQHKGETHMEWHDSPTGTY